MFAAKRGQPAHRNTARLRYNTPMQRTFRLALAQFNPTVGDVAGNTARIIDLIGAARAAHADLVAFPELAVTGYPPEDLLFKPSFLDDNAAAVARIAAATRGIAAVVGCVAVDGDIANAAAVIHDGRLIDHYHKIYLPNYGVFDEDRYFRRGEICPVYVINGVSVGVNICEDIWYPVGPAAVQRDAGAEIIVNINASPFHAGKAAQRERMIATRAADHGIYVAYLNTVGGQDELVFDGSSIICGPDGAVLARGPAFEDCLLVADLDSDAVFRQRLRDSRPRKEHPGIMDAVGRPQVSVVSQLGFAAPRAPAPPVIHPRLDDTEEIYQALVVGTRDYVRKSGFQRALVGLSGGIDSALTAAIAVDALGAANVLGVTMPSRYSSEGSVSDSAQLADNLGITLWRIPIEPAHCAFEELLAEQFAGAEPDVAEENVQARIRGNILMTISNKFGRLVLTTGNKSELAMGYATLYGDMAGGFAVLKDVPKTLVYALSRWRNDRTPDGRPLIPLSSLVKPPSAELRPNQTDQDSLPPYDLLDPIIKAYVEDDYGFAELVAMGHNPDWVRQVMSAVDRNEYKRRQAPPGVKITPRAFGKDRRLPLVNRYRPETAA